MVIPKSLKDEIWEYCRVNNISNIDEFTLKLVKQGFTVEKFGATPTARETIVEKIVEKIIEVPVEKIVERIVEVPVTLVDTEVSKELQKYMDIVNKLNGEVLRLTQLNETTKKELEREKNKNKRDFYGER